MTIGKKLFIGSGAMLLMLLAMAVSCLVSIGRLGSELEATGKLTARKIYLYSEMTADVNMVRANMRGIILFTVMGDGAGVQQNIESLDAQIASLIKDAREATPLNTTARGRELVASFEAQLPRLSQLSREIKDLCAAGKTKEAAIMLREAAATTTDTLEKTATELRDKQREHLESSTQTGDREISRAKWIAWSLALASALLGIIILKVIDGMSRQLRHATSQLAEGASQISAAAAQVASSSQSLAQGASEEAASIEETSASAEEIAAMTEQNTESAHDCSKLMVRAQEIGKSGRAAAQQLGETMNAINSSSQEISKILKVIDDISFQTNILALNAAVEAARAGESGAGFAVVADEVRSLARRCAEAAAATTELVTRSVATAQEGNLKLQAVNNSLGQSAQIRIDVQTVADRVSKCSDEQRQCIQQISQAVHQLGDVAQTTASGAEESASASEELSAQAQALGQIVLELQALVGGAGQEAAVVRTR
jgi:methyl-accepting chemotaxis protein/methyl-accepting chemotaxis protein-1 (serine sensor receptor)